VLSFGWVSSCSRLAKFAGEKGKPLLSLSATVSLLESALREERGLLQQKGSLGFGDSELGHLKISRLSRLACHGSEQAFIDEEGGS